ncbi:MAG: hypothetical protein FWG74_08415 [Planctomycetes bacterium]|nr:hypothetical protein [Planctomycetota bacterium]
MVAAATLLTLRVPDFDAAVRAAVEPRLRGRPVVVATSLKTLGRVLAASPAARAAGIGADTLYPMARMLCPDAAFFVPNRELAGRAIRAMTAKATEYSPLVEFAGDVCVILDTKGTERLWGAGLDVAEKLRAALRRELRLPAAAGLASRRPWSLLASRAAGDDGAWWVAPGQEECFLNLTPTAWIDGVGLRTRERLAELNIQRVGQLRQFPLQKMIQQFGGRDAKALWAVIAPDARDAMPVASHIQADGSANAVRAMAVIPEATVLMERLRIVARTLAAQVAFDLHRRNLGAAWLRLSLLYVDGASKMARRRTGGFTQNEDDLVALAEGLLAKAFTRRVAVSRLWLDAEKLGEPMRQGVLFPSSGEDARFGDSASGGQGKSDQKRPEATARLRAAIDRIRVRYGDAGIQPGIVMEGGLEQRRMKMFRRIPHHAERH